MGCQYYAGVSICPKPRSEYDLTAKLDLCGGDDLYVFFATKLFSL